MKYLLDTHFVLWSLYKTEKLPNELIEIINNENNDIYVSTASIWEIATKHLKNPKAMPISGIDFYQDCLENNYYILPILAKDIVDYEELKINEGQFVNKDPFDRMLVAQARHQKYLFCTCDHCMKHYDYSHIICY